MASGALGKRLDRAKWDVLLNGRKSYAKLTEVRGIANSKNLVLIQGLVCGRWSVCGRPKAIGTRRHGALKLSLRHRMDTVTREYVGESELPKKRTQSEVEALRCAGRGHTWRDPTGELDCSSAYIRLREPNKSEDKVEGGSTDREESDAGARQCGSGALKLFGIPSTLVAMCLGRPQALWRCNAGVAPSRIKIPCEQRDLGCEFHHNFV
ncbi:hypothetical protein B296_00003304 [Ensete ventricosum]|uniref:Uncharacterized protein n=1 Tax=Ensete ventricosum TaxID=4639 RepID=A0A427ATW6_ENSVE|nr:hypothetical protein B296_00003304 [Ensete ventricosum]